MAHFVGSDGRGTATLKKLRTLDLAASKYNGMRRYLALNPFHLPWTLIYREPDGEWMYWCSHCGRKPIPTFILRTLVLLPLSNI